MAPRTLPTVSPNLGFANWTPSTALAEHSPFRFLHKLTHAADMDSGQVPVSPYAHNLFSYHYMHGLINPPPSRLSSFRVSGPETRSRPPSCAAQLMVEHFLAVANFLLPQSTSSSRSLLALHILMPRLLLSSALSQPDLSRVQYPKGKGKVVLGDSHGSFERSDWLHLSLSLSLRLSSSGDNNPRTPPLVRPCARSHLGNVARFVYFTPFQTRARTPSPQYSDLRLLTFATVRARLGPGLLGLSCPGAQALSRGLLGQVSEL